MLYTIRCPNCEKLKNSGWDFVRRGFCPRELCPERILPWIRLARVTDYGLEQKQTNGVTARNISSKRLVPASGKRCVCDLHCA